MNFVLDVHCHTVNSGHAYSTISENTSHAAKIGLKYTGIADHAPGMPGGAHFYHFTNIWSLPEVINGVRVFKGAECNIMDEDGNLDLPAEVLARMDFVIASFHRGSFPPKNKEVHTRAVIRAMEKYRDMHIFGHPADLFFDIDIEAVIKTAAQTRTIIEINNQSLNPSSYRYKGDEVVMEILGLCKKYAVPVLASSDAHFCTLVGELSRAKEAILAAGIDEGLVLNTGVERFLGAIESKRKGVLS
ncbi:MAG: phosphatase [Defluviitaleaceae bacterium]|nr:phosphatase [Defluviitaleaceae bacterium]